VGSYFRIDKKVTGIAGLEGSASANAVYGVATISNGVYGVGGAGGVYGYAHTNSGVVGLAEVAYGGYFSAANTGLYAEATTGDVGLYSPDKIKTGDGFVGNGAGITNLNLDAMAWLTNAVTYTADTIELDGTARNIIINTTNTTTITLASGYPHGRDLAFTLAGGNAITWPVEYYLTTSVSNATFSGLVHGGTSYQGGTNYNLLAVDQ